MRKGLWRRGLAVIAGCFRVQCSIVTITTVLTIGTGAMSGRMSGRSLVLLAAIATGFAGCSSSTYDKDFTERITAYRSAAEFSPLHAAAAPLAGGRVLVRVPRMFQAEIEKPDQPGDIPDEKKPQFERAIPPFLRDFPGFARAYEVQLDVSGARMPAVLTVGVVPSAERRGEDVEARVLQQVREVKAFAGASWQKGREVTDAKGATRKWDVLTLKGAQAFDRIVGDQVQSKSEEGTCQIWASADAGQEFCTVLCWRFSDQIAAAVKLDELAPLVARTVAIASAQPPATP